MVKKFDLSGIKKEYENYDKLREKLIKKSRDVLKSAKQLGYAIHRGNKSECTKLAAALKKDYTSLQTITESNPKLQYEGSLNEASEEYAESMLYYDYMYNESLRTASELNVSDIAYLGGLADLTGELGRKSVQLAIKGEYKAIEEIRDFVSNLFKELMKFSFRNSSLRKKFDAVKWNLSKIEDILYDIEIKKK